MIKLISALKALPLVLALFAPVQVTPNNANVEVPKQEFVLVMPAKKAAPYSKNFLGFRLLGRLNTNIHHNLKLALTEYNGPKKAITSLRRNWRTNSKHNCGKAVDFEFDHSLIEWLVSEEGTAWRNKYGFTFYIEDRPGRKSLIPYKQNPVFNEYVFENPNATGPHIHLHLNM